MSNLKFEPLTYEYATKNIDGYLYVKTELRQDNNNQKYVNNDFWYTGLSRISKPLTLEDQIYTPYFQILLLGGGLKAKERFRTDVIVGNNSSAIFSSQSATKVYKDEYGDGPANYEVNFQIGSDSFVEYINDSVILYKDAKFKQVTNFYLSKSTTLFYSEFFSPGYSPDATKYAYNSMWLKTNIYVDDKLFVYDNLLFEPHEEDPRQFGIMDNYDRCGTCFIVSDKLEEKHIEEIRKIVHEEFIDIDHKIGISLFEANGLGIRILANQAYEIEKIVLRINEYIRKEFFNLGKLSLRKQ